MQRKKIIAANWKMNGSRQFAQDLVTSLQKQLEGSALIAEVILCPPSILVSEVRDVACATGWCLGVQNVAATSDGAFTGEISAAMARDAGCRYVIVGHSERRALFGDVDSVVGQKLAQVASAGLCPILCVGESLEERESGQAEAVVESQLQSALRLSGLQSGCQLVIAYEPVWAIGTGKSASSADAQAMHAFIRAVLDRLGWDGAAITILYGGSVKASSAAELFSQLDIDGGLVGGASLDAVEFAAICSAF